MRIAVVHDWLYTIGGAERVLAAIIECYPDADLFCLFDVIPGSNREFLRGKQSQPSFLQRMPGIARNHRRYLPLMPLAIEQLDLGNYDLVLSSSYAVAKGVITGPDQLHLSYVHSPMRYAWDLQHQYLRDSGMTSGVKGSIARILLHRMRLWDTRTANGVDAYAANSAFIARRIKKIYGRDSEVIYPPVSVPSELTLRSKEDFFLTASRLVPYKNIHTVIEAFRLLPREQLIVVGDGPEVARLRKLAGPNVLMAGFLPDAELRALMGAARAFVFAAEEDFGIMPVEAQAEGTPVIALGRGGARESVIAGDSNPTGLFFSAPEAAIIAEAVTKFIDRENDFSPMHCYANALRFSPTRFRKEFTNFVASHQRQFDINHQFKPTLAEVPPGSHPVRNVA
jgi:glycosyltransferase involved in cell wall biosynthesis